jgi:DNA-binding GntR family transcriptional regulator
MDYLTKEDHVAEFLREGIISGRFERGQRLKQADIAELLGLSITPVREALKLLEAEGYVSRESHHGVMVAKFDRDASGDVIGLRMTLEERLVRGAVIHMTPEVLAELREIEQSFEKAVAAGDRTSMRGINYRFHRHLYAQAQLPQTLHFVQILWAKYPFDVINVLKGRAARAVQEHRLLMKQVAAGDAEKAALAVRKHIEEGWRELQKHLNDEDTPVPAARKAAPKRPSGRSAGELHPQKLRAKRRAA